MTWQTYPIITYITLALWIMGLLLLIPKSSKLKALSPIIIIGGLITILIFTIGLWISLDRPVFRTLAETRLWYSIFTSIIGIVIYYRWRLWWMLAYTIGMSALFVLINFMNPDTYDKTLMPALQSPWFIPHVIVYIIGYAFLGASFVIGAKGLFLIYKNKPTENTVVLADNIVYIGFAFLTFGLLFGGLWAKEAWGHYWTWDPKETWAFLTWLTYLLYIHLRLFHKKNVKFPFLALVFAMVILLIAWFGVNYLPSADTSVHTY